jgi:hypothetical protein
VCRRAAAAISPSPGMLEGLRLIRSSDSDALQGLQCVETRDQPPELIRPAAESAENAPRLIMLAKSGLICCEIVR